MKNFLHQANNKPSLLFFVVLSFVLLPSVALGCTCFDTADNEVPVNPDLYCIEQECAGDPNATALSDDNCEFGEPDCEFVTGQCICDSPASISAFSCEDVCVYENYSPFPTTEATTSTPPAPTSSTPPSVSRPLITPKLSVDIPTVKFTDTVVSGDTLKINFMADYIAGLYKWLIGVATLIAIVFIMIGGLQYALFQQKEGTKRIKNAVAGLVLLLSTYIILATINPRLVILEMPELQVVKYAALESIIKSAVEECKDLKGTVAKCSAKELKSPSGWSQNLTDIVNSVAKSQSVDPILIATHIQKETGGNINYSRSIGPCGEIGLSQFMPTTFESIVGQQCCTKNSSKKTSTSETYGKSCDNGSAKWPPPTSEFSKCNTDICGSCQIAAESCIDYFDTAKSNGVQNTVIATAKLIKYNLSSGKIGGDIAMAMCAYNGSGKAAATYAKDAAGIYKSMCQNSGGTLGGQ